MMKDFPEGFLQSIKDVQGFDETSFIAAHQLPAVTSLRLHPLKKRPGFEHNAQVPWCNDGVYLEKRPVFTLDPLFHAGAYYVQEASSMFLDHALRSVVTGWNNLRVLDLCAAPGGKSTLIASLLGKDSLLISNEVIRTRASILEENMTRWGYMNTWVTSNDARDFGKLQGYFDVIVVDAPCSGSGLFRKDEKAKQEWSNANVQLCSARQERIVADVWPSLKEEGILLYATCSYSEEEDEMLLDKLADMFAVESLLIPINEDWGIKHTVSEKHGIHGYRFFPGRVNGEGLFLAAIRKKDEAARLRPAKFKSLHNKQVYEQGIHLLGHKNVLCVETGKDNYSFIHPVHEHDIHVLSKNVYLRKTGLAAGAPSFKEWIPSHDVALSIDKSENIPTLILNKEDALRFLKKEDMSILVPSKGWYIMTYEGLGLGWVKSLGNRFNNYLPKNQRIRMDIDEAPE